MVRRRVLKWRNKRLQSIGAGCKYIVSKHDRHIVRKLVNTLAEFSHVFKT